jgi:hypothetical protein
VTEKVEFHLRRLGVAGPDAWFTALLLVQAAEAQLHGTMLDPPPGRDRNEVVAAPVALCLRASEQPTSRDRRRTTAARCVGTVRHRSKSLCQSQFSGIIVKPETHPRANTRCAGGQRNTAGPLYGSQGFVTCRKLHRGATKGPDQFLLLMT